MISSLREQIFSTDLSFTEKALLTFRFQYNYNALYKRFVDELNCDVLSVKNLEEIPFLPISFFKTHTVASGQFEPEIVFESSGTTGSVTSRHFVKEVALYEASFIQGFIQFYGPIDQYCILGLLPSYFERKGSSLVYMVQKLMELSSHPENGFYLRDENALAKKLHQLESSGQKTILFGVTYALLDFATSFPMPLKNTIVIETGGMKGRKREIVRDEVHAVLKNAFSLPSIHSEYGMTELLSQAYAKEDGLFFTPPWTRILLRDEDDPRQLISHVSNPKVGAINIIDLANLYSCSFIATDDLGRMQPDGSLEVLGRMDNSDVRGCSLLL